MLVLHTLRFADEVVDRAATSTLPKPGRGPGEREVKMAQRLVDTLHTTFRPEDYEDEYRDGRARG